MSAIAPDFARVPAAGIDLSIVVPVYNEEENLPLLWPEIREVLDPTGLSYEVIFVDDGSRDRSAEIVRSFHERDPRARLVRLKANAGETAATDAGFKSVRGRWVVVMDADLQNDPADIGTLLPHMKTFDLVCGWRKERQDPFSKKVPSLFANRIMNDFVDLVDFTEGQVGSARDVYQNSGRSRHGNVVQQGTRDSLLRSFDRAVLTTSDPGTHQGRSAFLHDGADVREIDVHETGHAD